MKTECQQWPLAHAKGNIEVYTKGLKFNSLFLPPLSAISAVLQQIYVGEWSFNHHDEGSYKFYISFIGVKIKGMPSCQAGDVRNLGSYLRRVLSKQRVNTSWKTPIHEGKPGKGNSVFQTPCQPSRWAGFHHHLHTTGLAKQAGHEADSASILRLLKRKTTKAQMEEEGFVKCNIMRMTCKITIW